MPGKHSLTKYLFAFAIALFSAILINASVYAAISRSTRRMMLMMVHARPGTVPCVRRLFPPTPLQGVIAFILTWVMDYIA